MIHPNALCCSSKPHMNCAHHHCTYHRRRPVRGVNGLDRCGQIAKYIDDYIYLFIALLIYIYVWFWTSQTNKAWLWHWLLNKGCLNISKCLAPKEKKSITSFYSNGEINIFGVFLWIACEGVINILRQANISIIGFYQLPKVFFLLREFISSSITFFITSKNASVLPTITICKCVIKG